MKQRRTESGSLGAGSFWLSHRCLLWETPGFMCYPGTAPPPPGFWEPKPSGQPGGEAGGRRREAGGGRREAGGNPSPGCLGPQEETVASKFHSKLLAAQTCSRGGARSPSRLRGGGGRWGGGREVVGGGRWWGRGQASSISQPKEGRGRLGSARVGVKGKEVPAEGRALMWKEALTQAEGRPKTKLGNLNLTLF